MPTDHHDNPATDNPAKDGLKRITAVIFDYGEVLCYRPPPDEFRRMAEIFALSLESFLARWESSRALIDRADLTNEQYWEKFAAHAKTTITAEQINTLVRWEIEMGSHPNPVMVDWMLQLGDAGIKTALLSNMPLDLAAHLQQLFGWMSKFNFKTFSSHVRLLKPDPAIYEHTLRGLGVPPAETLFVDDRLPNIEAARVLGICALQFRSTAELTNDLQTLNFPILPKPSTASSSIVKNKG